MALSSESESHPEIASVRKVVVDRSGPAGDAVGQLPVRKVLVGAQSELQEKTVAQAAVEARQEGDDDLGVGVRLDVEGAAPFQGTRGVGYVEGGEAEAGSQEPGGPAAGTAEVAL